MLEGPVVRIHFSLLNLFDLRLVARDLTSIAKSNFILTSLRTQLLLHAVFHSKGTPRYILLRSSFSMPEITESTLANRSPMEASSSKTSHIGEKVKTKVMLNFDIWCLIFHKVSYLRLRCLSLTNQLMVSSGWKRSMMLSTLTLKDLRTGFDLSASCRKISIEPSRYSPTVNPGFMTRKPLPN